MNISEHSSPNHGGRHGRVIEGVVIHVMEGSMDATASWFGSPKSSVSAHYGVSKLGAVVRYVDESLAAWHAGRVERPTAELVLDRPGINPNEYTIGIEHEGDGTEELTDAQRAATIELVRDICTRHEIPIDRYHIVGHHEIYAPKPCPGAIDVDALVEKMQAAE